MGRRVEAASNAVTSAGPVEEAIYCPTCGDEQGEQGYAPVEYAENRWINVDGTLCCSVYCAAIESGMSEEDAQLARAVKTRMDMREAGLDAEADADLANDPEDGPFAMRLDQVADDDDHRHEQTVAVEEGDADEAWSSIVQELRNEGGEA